MDSFSFDMKVVCLVDRTKCRLQSPKDRMNCWIGKTFRKWSNLEFGMWSNEVSTTCTRSIQIERSQLTLLMQVLQSQRGSNNDTLTIADSHTHSQHKVVHMATQEKGQVILIFFFFWMNYINLLFVHYILKKQGGPGGYWTHQTEFPPER
jgi:hypothetical protein